MTLTARPRFLIRFAVLAALALCGIVLALSSTGTPPVGAQDGSAPAKPTGVVATATHDSVALAWDDPDDASITHYQIFRRDRDVHDTGEFVTIEDNTGSAAASYTDDTVEPETRYVYRVKAVNQHGASTWSDFVRADTPAAPDPADLAPSGLVVSLLENRVTLTWDAPASDAASVTGYEILRRRPNDGEAALTTLVANTGNAETGYTDDTANEPGVRYTYRVKALRDGEQSKVSNYARIDLPDDYAQDTPEPEEEPSPEALAPSGLTAAVEDGGVALSWTAPTEDAGSVTGYEVLRAQGSAELATLAADTGNTDTTYTDSGVTGDLADYRYQVKALRGGDASQGSNVAGVLQSAHAGAIVPLDDVTLISNLDQSRAGGGVFNNDQAQAFTTGSNSGGYSLTKVVIESSLGADADFTVSVHENDSGAPGTSLGTLTKPTLPATDTTGDYEFTHSGIDLAVSTTYFIVVDVSTSNGAFTIWNTNSDAEDTGGATGWSIGDSSLYRGFGSTGSWTTWAESKKISITGTVKGGTTNSDATGAPVITGTPEVGELLTADISNIGDADGIADADFEYQWIANDGTTDSDIDGATGETYRPLLAHVDQTIKVRVTFDDDDDNAESLTSAATAAVTASTYGQVIWAATLTVEEETVAAGTFFGYALFTRGSLEPISFTHDGLTLFVSILQYLEGAQLRWEFSGGSLGSEDFNLYLDGAPFLIESPGTDTFLTFSDHGLTWTDEQEVEVRLTVNRAATGAPAITGKPEVGETLTASISGIMDDDGLPVLGELTYQWISNDGTDDSDIDGATDSTYTLVEADAGKSITVRVSFTDNAKFPESLTSAATGPVTAAVAALISNVGQTAATGDAQVSTSQSQAQGFTTGSDSGGYTLGSVELAVSSFSGTASDITVSIYSESSGDPGTVVHTLTTPASISAAVTTFTAPSGATLAASTTYYVVISTTSSGISLSRTDATAEDTGGVSGWSIADSRRFFGSSGWNTTTRPIRMRVNGDAATSTNSPATGAPVITGTPAVGELLTADISNIGDADGIADADFEYQWIAFDGTTDSDIDGATGETYRPLLAHLGQTIKVRVSFDDDDDNAESLTSAPTAAVTASTYGQVIWAATLTVEEETVAAGTFFGYSIGGRGSLEPNSFTHDGNSTIVTALQYLESQLRFFLSGDPLGSEDFNLYLDGAPFLIESPGTDIGLSFEDHGLTWTDEQEVEVRLTVNRPATGAPAITGKPEVGETLTASISAIMDEDGVPAAAQFAYQWISNDGTDDSDIDGATDSTYTLMDADEGKSIKVRVSFTDNAKFPESLTSAPTAAVTASTYGQVIWSAKMTVETNSIGGIVTLTGFSIESGATTFGELEPNAFSYDSTNVTVIVLYRLTSPSDDYVSLVLDSGLGDGRFILHLDEKPFLIEEAGEQGTSIIIQFEDHGISWSNNEEVEVRLTVNRPATGAPAITGKPEVGETLTADVSGIMDEDGVPAAAEFAYQWISNDGTDDSDIDGATDSTYTLVQADAGKTIKVRVSFTDDAKFPESLTSAATTAVTGALVSNVGQTATGNANVTATQSQGQGFTTGSDSGGYTLGSVELAVSSFSGTASDITVSIYSESSGDPGTLVHTLTTPASISTPVTTFTAPSGTTLAAGTTYYVVISTTGSGINLGRTNAAAEDTGGASGWSIADDRRLFAGGNWVNTTSPIRMRINGATATTSTDIWSATLTVAEFTIDPNTYRGYTHVGTAVGELDPSTFSHDGNEITVNNLWHIVGGLLTFEISQELGGEGFLLRLGETLLPLGEPTGDPPVYQFSDHGVSWSVGDTVEVRLIPNQAATGAPVITGTPVVGETLTADTDGIGDPDGIDNADFSYQWIANDGTDDSDIEGATDSTYTLVFADYGNTIKVRVSFTDDNDYPESLTSTAVAVASPYGDVIHSALLTVGIGAFFSGYSSNTDTGDLEPAEFTHNGNSATVQVLAYIGNVFHFQTSPALGSGNYGLILDDTPIQLGAASGSPARHQVSDHGLTWTVDQQVEVWLVLNNAPTGEPVITGTPVVSQTLTAGISGIMDTDGRPADDQFSYQWIRSDGATDSDISGATNATHKLGSADLDKTIKVRVTFTDGGGFPERLTSDATGPVTPLTVSSDWSLTPSSLNPGDRFRLMFLTTSRNATPKDIDVYNEWVQGRAAGGHDAIREYAGAFNLLGCTEDVAARDNTGTTYTTDDKGVRIYWLNGPKVVDDYEDLYDGGWDEEAKMRNRGGSERDNPEYVWTGCGHNGAVSSGAWLGHDKPTIGLPDGTEATGGPLSSSLITDKAGFLTVYALSDVFAVAVPATEVPVNWSLVPSGLGVGDEFRLLFLSSSSRNAVPTSIATYNTWIQNLAAAGHTDIRRYSSTFNVVGSTEDMDARDNTGTTYTSGSSYKGVPIYWLNGNNVADHYPDFYDGGWDEEASMRTEAGTSIEAPGGVFTGSDHDGTEQFSSANNSRALGAGLSQGHVGFGRPNSQGSDDGPLAGGSANKITLVPFYGLSGVFRVVANNPATGKPVITGTPEVNQTLTADVSAIMDEDGVPAADQFSYQWIRNDGTDDSDISGATDSTYTLKAADQGKTIKVKVTFTDEGGIEETLTSEATAEVTGPVTVVPADWSLIPSGLGPGDHFRLIFLSSATRTAEATDIATYNIWVQGLAANGHTDIQDHSSTFRVVGSTAAVDARDNTSTTGTGVPIHWLGGNKAADDYGDFYDETWDEEASISDESGTTVTPRSVFTGSNHDGTKTGQPLGTNVVTVGVPNSTIANDGPLSSDTSEASTGDSHLYALSGVFRVGAIEVPADWSLVPSGLQEGDQFRLLFISSMHRSASPSEIATYNTWIQARAANGHTDIQDYSSSFRAVGSTEDMDARDNTGTTYTSSDKGVAIYWLGGNKVADDYEDFYDEDWDEEAAMKNESGTAESGVSAWTGSDHDGTEMLQGTPETSRALGNSNNAWVRFGKTDSASHGPLSGETANRTGNKRIYGLSGVFEVVVGNTPATGALTITGTAQVGGVLTANLSNVTDPDGLDDVSYSYQWIADDGTTETDIDHATGETYRPITADEDKTVKVRVSFTDDEGNPESLTSAATGAVSPWDKGELIWSALLTVGEYDAGAYIIFGFATGS